MQARFPERVNVISCPFAGAPLFLYMIQGDGGGLTLVDSGIAGTPSRFVLPHFAARGRSAADLRWVVITHAHHDHFGGNGELYRANPAIEFMASEADREWIEDSGRHFQAMYRLFPGEWEPDAAYERVVIDWCGDNVPVARTLREGDAIAADGLAPLRVHEVPGHSPGHLMFALERERACFVGDAIQGEGTRLESGIAVFPLYDDVDAYLRSLGRIRQLDVDWVCTGHDGPLDREAAERLLAKSERHVHAHGDRVLRELGQAGRPIALAELTRRLYKAYYTDYELAYQLHATTFAHCRHLQRQGAVKRVYTGGKLQWTTV